MAFETIQTQVFVILKHCKVCGMLLIASSFPNKKSKRQLSAPPLEKKLLDSSITTSEIRSFLPYLSKFRFYFENY